MNKEDRRGRKRKERGRARLNKTRIIGSERD